MKFRIIVKYAGKKPECFEYADFATALSMAKDFKGGLAEKVTLSDCGGKLIWTSNEEIENV